jgi:outer membrane protein assembly complex protein YaeT
MPRPRGALPTLLLCVALLAACKEKGDIRIEKLTFEGVKQVDKTALANALETKQGSRFPWGRKQFFDRRAFDADLKRIDAFYRDRGFPDERVTSFNVDLNQQQDAVKVVVTISEGEPIRVADISLQGFDVLKGQKLDDLEGTLPLKKGQPLDRQLAVATRERAVNVLKDSGYPYALVAMRPEDAGPRMQRIILEATPGPIAHFGVIDVRGEKSVSANVIQRQLTFKTNDTFTRKEMLESQRKLYGQELFNFVNIEPLEEPDVQATEIPVRVTVAEAKHQKITTGFGYGSEEKARAQLRWDHVNFLGGARHAGFEGRWSSLDRGVRMDYTEPYVFTPHFSLRFEGQAWDANEPVYSQQTIGGRLILRHQANQQSSVSVSYINEYEKSSIAEEALNDPSIRNNLIALGLDPRTGEARGTTSALALDVNRNTTNNLLDASRGYVFNGHLEQAGRFMGGSYNYVTVGLEGRYFHTIADKAVFAQKINVGGIRPASLLDANVPFHKRLFLGGATSIRGWGRYEVSPLSELGYPIGGLSMLEGSSELRVPLQGKLGLVAFADYGNVWSRSSHYDLGDLRYAVGSGLRYLTPIGPARVDFGYQLNPIPGLLVNGEPQQRRWRVHFSIGQAF